MGLGVEGGDGENERRSKIHTVHVPGYAPLVSVRNLNQRMPYEIPITPMQQLAFLSVQSRSPFSPTCNSKMSSSPNCTQSSHPSTVLGETLATYHWPSPSDPPLAAVFLLHGFRAHTRFNFLRSDSPSSLHQYGDSTTSSFIRELNIRNFAVHAHDHLGFGASSGLRAYFPSFQALVDDLMSFVRRVDDEHQYSRRRVPLFLTGHSMGGTVAIVAARDHPDIFEGMTLSSPATEPPENMFGFVGRVQAALSGITSVLIPTAQLVALPKGNDEELRRLFEADELNYQEKLRARVGREFLNVYGDVSRRVGEVRVPFLIASGELDTLVNPQAARRFYESAASEDKQIAKAEGRWHNLLVENGKEEIWTLFAEWILERAKKFGRANKGEG